jgi:hypothetical protein
MPATSRVAGAVAAGYVLGRFKKLRLAVLVGSTMASPKFRSAAAGMIQDRLPGSPVVGTLTKEVGGKLINVGKTAATSIVASRVDSLSQSLADRSQNLQKGSPDGHADKSRAEEPEDEYEEPKGEAEEPGGGEAEEPEDEYEEQEGSETEEPEDQNAQADDDASRDEEPEEPEARSPRRRRSASPAGRKRG